MKSSLLASLILCTLSFTGIASAQARPLISIHSSATGASHDSTAGSSDACQPLDSEHLSARYQVSNPQGQTWEMQLIRNQQQLIIQRSAVSFEQWDHDEYVRYFPEEKRSVTYRKGDLLALNIQYNQSQLYHLVSPQVMTVLTQTQALQQGCFATQGYQGELNGHASTLEWIKDIALPYSFSLGDLDNSGKSQPLHYQLLSVSPFSREQFIGMTQGYNDIDFADVGDSESDPFIAKMISQGFIQHGSEGFYNSDGETIKAAGGHSNHSH